MYRKITLFTCLGINTGITHARQIYAIYTTRRAMFLTQKMDSEKKCRGRESPRRRRRGKKEDECTSRRSEATKTAILLLKTTAPQ